MGKLVLFHFIFFSLQIRQTEVRVRASCSLQLHFIQRRLIQHYSTRDEREARSTGKALSIRQQLPHCRSVEFTFRLASYDGDKSVL